VASAEVVKVDVIVGIGDDSSVVDESRYFELISIVEYTMLTSGLFTDGETVEDGDVELGSE